ncbi:hypothetical protein ACP70R_017874 [Stipagrostis hirtigluma subsp. patula]
MGSPGTRGFRAQEVTVYPRRRGGLRAAQPHPRRAPRSRPPRCRPLEMPRVLGRRRMGPWHAERWGVLLRDADRGLLEEKLNKLKTWFEPFRHRREQ